MLESTELGLSSVTYFCAIKKLIGDRRDDVLQKQQATLAEELSLLKHELADMQARKEEMERHLNNNMTSLVHAYTYAGTNGMPNAFMCPITREVMTEPVMLVESGHTYERSAIEAWLRGNGRKSDPLTNKVLQQPPQLAPNYALLKAMHEFKQHTKAIFPPGSLDSGAAYSDNQAEHEDHLIPTAMVEVPAAPANSPHTSTGMFHSASSPLEHLRPGDIPAEDPYHWVADMEAEYRLGLDMITFIV